MNFFSILIVASVLAWAPMSSAFDVSSELRAYAAKKVVKQARTNVNVKCVNFSGDWEGTCKGGLFGDKPKFALLMIRQSMCDSLQTLNENDKKQNINIGYASSESSSDMKNGVYGRHSSHPRHDFSASIEWDSTFTRLVSAGAFVAHSGSSEPDFSPFVISGSGEMKIQDGKLFDTVRFTIAGNGLASADIDPLECIYSRK